MKIKVTQLKKIVEIVLKEMHGQKEVFSPRDMQHRYPQEYTKLIEDTDDLRGDLKEFFVDENGYLNATFVISPGDVNTMKMPKGTVVEDGWLFDDQKNIWMKTDTYLNGKRMS
jgi:hypothetical protein